MEAEQLFLNKIEKKHPDRNIRTGCFTKIYELLIVIFRSSQYHLH
jgi:hypothetical protein